MGLRDKKLRDKLSKYPKSDIIDAIFDEFNADRIVSNMLFKLRDRSFKRSLQKEKDAFSSYEDARSAYAKWFDEMMKKYGEGGKINLDKLTDQEISKGSNLAKAMESSGKEFIKCMRDVDKSCDS